MDLPIRHDERLMNNHKYVFVSDGVCITRIRENPSAYQCWNCELQLFHVVLTSPRELLDHVELHKRAGHELPPDALEKVKKELENA